MKLNKMASVLLGMVLCTATTLFAADEEMVKMEMSRKPNGCTGPTLCPTGVMLRDNACDASWKFQIGLIYEQPRFGEMHPGKSYTPTNLYDTSADWVLLQACDLEATFDYTVGLLIDLGYFLDHDNWFANVHFDWLNASYRKTYDVTGSVYEANADIDNVIFTGLTVTNYDSIQYNASMAFYTLDFTLSRGAWVSKCFSFTYGTGIEALWFNTRQTANYVPNFADTTNVVTYDSKQENWGVGPQLSLNAEYHLVQELYFFFDNSIAVLYGEANENRTSTIAADGTFVEIERQVKEKVYYSMQYLVPIRTTIGAKFGKYCLEDKHYIGLKVGYDARAVLAATNPSNGFVTSGLYLNFEWSF